MSKKILLSPLDWGMGHATRCVPIIRTFLEEGHEVILGTTPLTEKIFTPVFPDLKRFEMPPAGIEYSKNLPVWFSVMLDYPRLINVVQEELETTQSAVRKFQPDVIVSDNRYGFFYPEVKNIFITHQLNVKSPFFNKQANMIHLKHIQKFNEVWVPDFEHAQDSLAGDLSHGGNLFNNTHYIGPLSRLSIQKKSNQTTSVLFLLSGPEPKRMQLEKEILEWRRFNKNISCILVRGTDLPAEIAPAASMEIYDLPDEVLLSELIARSSVVVSRSGYSTVMDVYGQQKQKFLIPTPGQTEQEYLADFLDGKFGFKKLKSVADLIIQPEELNTEFTFSSVEAINFKNIIKKI